MNKVPQLSFGLRPSALLVLGLVLACGGDSPTDNNEPPPPPPPPPQTVATFLEVVAGNGQQDTVAQLLAIPVTVRVLDQDSLPLPDIGVRFALPTGRPPSPVAGPQADTLTVQSDSAGLASAQWTMPEVAGTFIATASVTGVPAARFMASAVPDQPQSLTLIGVADYGAPLGTAISDPVSVRVTDQFGNARSGVTLAAAITKGNGTLPAAALQTDAIGIVRFGWIVGTSEGLDSLTITAPGLGAVAVEAHAFVPPLLDSLALGSRHSCHLGAALRCWGNDSAGAVGTGTPQVVGPVTIPTPVPLRSITAGETHTCGLGAGGDVYCWGQVWTMGLNALQPQLQVPGRTYRTLTAGSMFTCGVTATWTAECWGLGNFNQLGFPAVFGWTTIPGTVSAGVRFTQVSAGHDFACGVSVGARVWCWGSNSSGKLGRGTLLGVRHQPVASTERFREVAAGNSHACGLTLDGRTLCWGAGWGAPSPILPSDIPLTVPTPLRFKAIRAQGTTTCALALDDRLYCWGVDATGTNGLDAPGNASTAPGLPAAGGSAFRAVDLGYAHACGVRQDGGVSCWGLNDGLAVGIAPAPFRATPDTVGTSLRFSSLGLGQSFSCGLGNGAIWCWGEGGLLGTDILHVRATATPVPMPGGQVFTHLHVGGDGGCGLTAGLVAWCWGNPDPNWSTSAPDPVPGYSFTALASGWGSACGIATDRITRCWGYNINGELGDSTAVGVSNVPVVVVGQRSFAKIYAAWRGYCGLEADGRAWCWGRGALGNGQPSWAFRNWADSLPGGQRFQRLFLGYTETEWCGLTTADELWCWGSAPPAPKALGFTVTALVAGEDFTCALDPAGAASCWGVNDQGQLGDGTTTPRTAPAPVVNAPAFVSLSPGRWHMCGLDASGRTWCWGRNTDGQIGVPGPVVTPPVMVP